MPPVDLGHELRRLCDDGGECPQGCAGRQRGERQFRRAHGHGNRGGRPAGAGPGRGRCRLRCQRDARARGRSRERSRGVCPLSSTASSKRGRGRSRGTVVRRRPARLAARAGNRRRALVLGASGRRHLICARVRGQALLHRRLEGVSQSQRQHGHPHRARHRDRVGVFHAGRCPSRDRPEPGTSCVLRGRCDHHLLDQSGLRARDARPRQDLGGH